MLFFHFIKITIQFFLISKICDHCPQFCNGSKNSKGEEIRFEGDSGTNGNRKFELK